MEYWYLWLIFIVLCVVTAFVLKKASAALQQHNSDTKQMYDEIERLKTLKAKYQNADAQQISEADADELLAGMCAVLQAKIERAANANDCFCAFCVPQKTVYTLQFFLEDCSENLSVFFKVNGEPLTGALPAALAEIGETALSALAAELYAMYDDKNEEVSLDTAEIARIDGEFSGEFDPDRVLQHIKVYIEAHFAEILA
ncbi:MAG: hypothetical protein ACI4K9_02040 [Candidatus Fimenecus sp.]